MDNNKDCRVGQLTTVQGALRQPGRPRVELLPRLHQEEVDVDGRLFVNSRLKWKESV